MSLYKVLYNTNKTRKYVRQLIFLVYCKTNIVSRCPYTVIKNPAQ